MYLTLPIPKRNKWEKKYELTIYYVPWDLQQKHVKVHGHLMTCLKRSHKFDRFLPRLMDQRPLGNYYN